jgi:hypothetical protein
MKRMTISRSRGTHLAGVAFALSVVALPLAAQQQQQQPQQQQQQGRDSAARAGQAIPSTHVVQQGETLWGLAKQFLGDPLLWPEIYRLNTTVVEDPKWIFPGEELRLASSPEPAMAAAPAAEQAPGGITVAPSQVEGAAPRAQPSRSGNPFDAPTIFSARTTVSEGSATLQLKNQQAYRSVRVGEHYSAGFLTEDEQLNAGRLLGNKHTASISRLTSITTATLFSEVAFTPPPGDTLKPGDLLLAYETPRVIEHYGRVVRPTGLLRVTGVAEDGQTASAQVIGVYQSIASGQQVIRVQPFRASAARAVATDSGIVASVIGARDPHELMAQQDILFLDRGAEDSVRLGDIFQISGVSTASSGIGRVVQNSAQILIVYVRPHTSTGVVIQLDRADVRTGAAARQIRRMPS